MDRETKYDTLLQIKTCGRDDSNADAYHHPYEPTPYSVLLRLADSGLFAQEDTVLDYGCGKGRVGFFLSHKTKTRVIGIEYDEHICHSALKNQKTAIRGTNTEFILAAAEEYQVPAEVTRCYFFNPFSVEILHKVMARIAESYYENPREISLFFYYPSDAYLAYLMTVEGLDFYDEIDCEDLFDGENPRERVMIFQFA